MSDVGTGFIKANNPLVTVAEDIDDPVVSYIQAHPRVLDLAKTLGGVEIVSVRREAKECAA